MTRIIHLGTLQAEQLAFSYSPLHETIHSLHILARSKQHPLHLPWVQRVRQLMPPLLKAEVSAFSIFFESAIPDIFAGPLQLNTEFPSIDEELHETRTLAPHDFAERVINQTIMRVGEDDWNYTLEQLRQSTELQQQVLARTAETHPGSVQVVEELFMHPAQSHQRFLRFFTWYWEVCLAPEWPQLEAMLVQDIQQRGKLLFEQGLLTLLGSLAPQLHVSQQEEEITLQYPSQFHVEMQANRPLFLIPSSYVWPRLSFMYDGETLVALVYSIKRFQDEGNAPVPPERLLKLLRATGDATRLQILQLLSQRPRSTRELAGLLSLSEAGISKHVKILQDADFLRAERSSYYVLYQSRTDPLAEISRGLDSVLQGTSPTEGSAYQNLKTVH